jgi:transposase-like protein
MRVCQNTIKNLSKMPSKRFRGGQSVASLSRELGVSESVLHKWRKAKLETSSDLEKEILELKKQLREVEMERDILKKAATNRTAEELRAVSIH